MKRYLLVKSNCIQIMAILLVFVFTLMASAYIDVLSGSIAFAGYDSKDPPRYDLSGAPDSWDPNVIVSPKKYLLRQFTHNGKSIDEIIVPGRPPKNFRVPVASMTMSNSILGVSTLPNVPAFDWSYGCSATSAAMMMGYYDNYNYPNMYTGPTNGGVCPMNNSAWGVGECSLSATHQGYDGRSIKGHVDDYWRGYNNNDPDPFIGYWTEHVKGDCTADYMGTNQSNYGNSDGSTTFYNYTDGSPLYDYTGGEPTSRDGCHGIRLFVESRGYQVSANYSQYIAGYNGNTLGFTFDQYKDEINHGRPVLIQVSGHTMLGYGYDTTGNIVYLHDTWDYSSHTMTWGGSYAGMQQYGVTVLRLVSLQSPLVINEPHEYTWIVGQNVSDSLSASGGLQPYHDWMVSSGSNSYTHTILGSSSFSAVGIVKKWKADDGSWSYTLPFAFPFYGSNYTNVNVCSNGFIDFTSTATSYSNSTEELISSVRIAPLWDDLDTRSGNIYIDESVSGQTTIRWDGVTYNGNNSVNFSATLFSDGRIRFDYGSGNTGLTPTIGISSGNGTNYILVSGYDGASVLSNANSVMFTPPGAPSSLPPGVVLNSNGSFSGAPTEAGDYVTTIQVSDSSMPNETKSQTFTFHVVSMITGRVILSNYIGDITTVPVTVYLNDVPYVVYLDDEGRFNIPNVPKGTYDVRIKASHWLTKMITGVVVN